MYWYGIVAFNVFTFLGLYFVLNIFIFLPGTAKFIRDFMNDKCSMNVIFCCVQYTYILAPIGEGGQVYAAA